MSDSNLQSYFLLAFKYFINFFSILSEALLALPVFKQEIEPGYGCLVSFVLLYYIKLLKLACFLYLMFFCKFHYTPLSYIIYYSTVQFLARIDVLW